MKAIINWKVFFILWIASILSVLAVIPYLLSLQTSVIQNLKLPIPLPAVIAIQTVQNAILFAILIFAGLFFMGRVGLTTPILDSVTHGEPVADKVSAILPISVILGVLCTLVVLGLDLAWKIHQQDI